MKVIVFATPVFLALIALELLYGRVRNRNTYRLSDTISSVSLGMLSQISAVFTRALRVGVYALVAAQVALFPPDAAKAFWTTWYGWLLALVFYDFCYYWLHRAGHECAVFWAAHVVHHQSQSYNLSTALRQTSSGVLLGWVFFLPMALAGVPIHVFAIVGLIDLLYQFWVHTEHVGKLGWFDRWFCSPSNHRVHHATNDAYLDKNYGGIFVFWDRMFGSFKDEDLTNPCVYGTRKALNSWDPLWANGEVYVALARDSWATRKWADKVRVWLKPPGWRPLDIPAYPPVSQESLAQIWAPPMSKSLQLFSVAQFCTFLLAVSAYLWTAEAMPTLNAAVWLAALTVSMWAFNAAMQGRFSVLDVLLIQSAVLATATQALGWLDLHRVFKPLVMVLAICVVASKPVGLRISAYAKYLLIFALLFSLAGDVFLMLNDQFVFGLASFLLAHVCFIALFKTGQVWFPSRQAAVLTALVGCGMYLFLWHGGLPVALRLPVAAYVAVIAAMAAQAIGRALVLQTPSARWVAAGACVFMLSDTLLALNKFVLVLPAAGLWVLSTYYLAQLLILRNALAWDSNAPGATRSP